MLGYLKKLRMYMLRLRHKRFLSVGSGFTCGRGTIFYAKNLIRVGNNVYFGRYCNIECDAEIGNDVLIANYVGFVGRLDHDYRQIGVPIRSARCIRDADYNPPRSKTTIIIGDDVWIGYGATILSGVTIGEGAIVAACSLVTKDVEPFSIVAGVPAMPIGKRFDESSSIRHKELCRQRFSSYRSSTF